MTIKHFIATAKLKPNDYRNVTIISHGKFCNNIARCVIHIRNTVASSRIIINSKF